MGRGGDGLLEMGRKWGGNGKRTEELWSGEGAMLICI